MEQAADSELKAFAVANPVLSSKLNLEQMYRRHAKIQDPDMEVEKKHKKEDKHLYDAQRFVMLAGPCGCTIVESQVSKDIGT
jgi:hypothetical protein